MRKIFKQFISLIAASTFLYGCVSEAIDFSENNNTETENVGYLSMSGLNINVDTDSGELIDTRTTIEAGDNYLVKIISSKENSIVFNGTYSEIKAKGELSLAPGIYKIDVKSIAEIPAAEWNAPHYMGSKEVTIVKKQTTEVNDLTCTLANIKTSLELSADLKDLFLPDDSNKPDGNLKVDISLGENTLTYDRAETRAAYFAAVEEKNTIKIELSGMYNTSGEGEEPTYEKIDKWTQTISNVKAGEWRKIHIRIENSNDGNVNFNVTVETWVYDEELNVDVMSSKYTFEEEEIYDPDSEITEPNSPKVTLLNGHNIEDTFLISPSIFDFDAETCIDVIKGEVTPVGESTIASIDIDFKSDNEALLSRIKDDGFENLKVALYPSNEISDYITIKEASESNRVNITVKNSGMMEFYKYAGTHTVRVIAIDSEGRRSFTNLVIKVEKEASSEVGPSIVWQGGYSFDTRHAVSLTTNPPVIIDITSATGITGFIINIDSDKLTPEELVGMKLAPEMDLINPATEEMKTALSGLGFKVGSAVEGATSVTFDITQFMPALALLGSGNSDFELKVTDASGTNTKTLKVKVN